MVQGLTPTHDVPHGTERRLLARSLAPLAAHFTVYSVNRKRGLQPGESMSDIARHLAEAIETDLGGPVLLSGTSSGGSVVLQLAIDRPDLVRRLIVVSAAHRLGSEGRALDEEMLRIGREVSPREAFAFLYAAMMPGPLRTPLRPVARLLAPKVDDPTDMMVTLEAESVMDVGPELHRITAPTLVIGGTEDRFYPRDVLEATAAGVVDGRVHLFEGWGHLRASGSKATTRVMLDFLLEGWGEQV